MSDRLPKITAGRLLARNTTLNVIGVGVPMIAAFVAIPLLVSGMGAARFGILTIGWVVVGYFGLFDCGLGMALTKLVAERLGTGRSEGLPTLVWTGILSMFTLGVVAGIALAGVAPWLVRGVLNIPPELQLEALRSFYLLAFSVPFVISTTGLQGVLEANQRFGLINALRIPMGIFNYLGPLAVLAFTPSLVAVIALLVGGRLVQWSANLAACLHVVPALRTRVTLQWEKVKELVRFGGWMAISNTISPLMTHMDRFLIGTWLSVAAVTYYVTPYEVVTKLLLFPTALIAVLFPAFAASFASDRAHTAVLFDRGLRAIFLITFPATVLIFTFAREGMTLWMGAEFASHASVLLRWLAIGVFINCLAQAPFALIQGAGRPDIVARLHMVELPLYVLAIWGLTVTFGLEGVAIAWALRVAVDAGVLFAVAERLVPTGSAVLRKTVQMIALSGVALAALALPDGTPMRIALVLSVAVLFLWSAWSWILTPLERDFVHRRVVLLSGKRPVPPDQPVAS
jgi:O-antigen/teichoic acid export membrane protein